MYGSIQSTLFGRQSRLRSCFGTVKEVLGKRFLQEEEAEKKFTTAILLHAKKNKRINCSGAD